MKMKKSVIALILLVVYGLSIVAGVMVYSRSPKQMQNIITYKIDSYSVANLIKNGATIMTFEYGSNCDTCIDQKAFLETMAKDYKNQMILEEILNESYNTPTLTMVSMYGNKTISNPRENETFLSLCDLLIMPPAECVAK